MEQPGGNIGIVVGIPLCGRPVVPEWAIALCLQNWPLNTNVTYCPIPGKHVAEARNEICEFAIIRKARYIWFIDDDTAPPTHAIRHLTYVADQYGPPFGNVAAVCGIYTSRTVPTEPIVYRGNGNGAFWGWKCGQVFDVTGCGTGCMLVRVECLAELEKPYFKTIDEPFPSKVATLRQTDDLYFCDKLQAAGFGIKAHGGVLADHWDSGYERKRDRRRFSMLDVPDSFPMRDLDLKSKPEVLTEVDIRGEDETWDDVPQPADAEVGERSNA